MGNRKIVVALGGNAILSSDPSAKAQQEALVETAKHLVKLIKNGDDLIITHGNGPQAVSASGCRMLCKMLSWMKVLKRMLLLL